MKLNDDTQWSIQDGNIADIDPQLAESLDDLAEDYANEWLVPEKERVTLPSSLASGKIEHLPIQLIVMVEAEL
jgi:hypothetical protein